MMKSLFRRSKKEQADDEPGEKDAPPDSPRKSRKSRSRGSTDVPQDENSAASSATSLSKSQAQLSQSQAKSPWGSFPGDPNYEGPHRIEENTDEDAPGPKKVESQMSAEEKFMEYYQQKKVQQEPAPAPPAPVAASSGDHLSEAALQEDERQQQRDQARQEQRQVRENAEQQAKERREALFQPQSAAEPSVDADELRKQRARQAVEDRKKKAREAVEARKNKAKQAAVNKEREAQGLPPIDNQAEGEEAKRKEQKAQEEKLEKEKKEEAQKEAEKKAQEERLEKEEKEEATRKAEEERVFNENQLARELRREEQLAASLVEKQKIANLKLEEEQAVLAEEKRMVEEQAFAIKALEELKHQEAAEKEKERLAKVQAEAMEKMAAMMNRGGKPAPDRNDSGSDDDDDASDSVFESSDSDPPPQQQQIDPNDPVAAMAAMQAIQQARAAPKAQARPKMPTGPVNVENDASLNDGASQNSEGDLSALLNKEMDDSDFLDAALEDGLGNSGGSQKIGKSSFAKPNQEPKPKSTIFSRRAKSDHPSKPVTGLRFFKPKTTGKPNGARTRLSAAPALPKTKPTPPKPTPPKPAPKKPTPPPVVIASPPKPAAPKKATPLPSPPKPASPQKAAPPKVVSPPKLSRPPSTTSRSLPKPIVTTPRQPNRDAFAFNPTQTPTGTRFGHKTPTSGAGTPSSFAKSPASSERYRRSLMHKSPRHYPTSPARSTMSACSDDGVDHLSRSPHMPLDESAGPICDNPFIAKLHETRGFCQVCIYHLTDSEKMAFEKNGRHLCVNLAYGGCLDCQVFPPEEEDADPVRLCCKCFFDTHKLHKHKEKAFGGTGAMAGTVSSPPKKRVSPSSHIRR